MRKRLFLVSLMMSGALFGWSGVAVADEYSSAPSHAVTPFTTRLTGAAEVPGPGDPDGRGRAVLAVDAEKGEICYVLVVRRIDPATAAHIHVGPPGVAGPIVQDLEAPTSGISADCVSNPGLAAAIEDDPGNYYVNVHNTPFPAGAVRGQLG